MVKQERSTLDSAMMNKSDDSPEYETARTGTAEITDLELPPINTFREAMDLTQQAFADRTCMSIRTLQHGQQGAHS